MRNKIISVILAIGIAILPSSSLVLAVENDVPVPDRFLGSTGGGITDNSKYETLYELLNYLGLVEEELESLKMQDMVTKAYAAKVISKISVGVAGDNTSLENVTYSELAEWLLRALGSTAYGQLMGYYEYAEEIDIFKNVNASPDGTLTMEQFFIVLENALNAKLTNVSFNGEDLLISENENKSYLSKNNILLQTGVVTGIGYTSFDRNKKLQEGKIEINKQTLNTLKSFDKELVGREVYAYTDFDDGKDVVITLWENTSKNTVWEITQKDFDGFSNGRIYAYNEQKSYNIPTDNDGTVFLNGVYYGKIRDLEGDTTIDNAHEITVIDNDRDGSADVISMHIYKDWVIDSVSVSSNIIAFMHGIPQLKLNDDNVIVNITMNGEPVAIETLKAYNIATVEEATLPSGEKVMDINVSIESISGDLMGEGNDGADKYYNVNGEKYYLTDDFQAYLSGSMNEERPGVGKSAVFYLSARGEIAAAKVSGGFSYGYLRKIVQDEDTEKYIIKLYTEAGMVETFEVKDKVKFYSASELNGERIKDNVLYLHLYGNAENSVVAYKVNNNVITEIALPIDRRTNTPGTIEYPLTMDHKFEGKEVTGKQGNGRLYINVFADKYIVSNTTTMVIPDDAEKKNDMQLYKVKRSLGGDLSGDHYFTKSEITLYNVDQFYCPKFATIEEVQAGLASMDGLTRSVMVVDAEETVDEDNMPITIMTYLDAGNPQTITFADDAVKIERPATENEWYGTRGSIDDISTGDIVQFETNTAGEISSIRVLVNYENLGNYRMQCGGETTVQAVDYDPGLVSLSVFYGKLVAKNGNILLVNTSSTGADTTDAAKQRAHLIGSTFGKNTYTMFDTKAEKVYNASVEDLLPGDTVILKKTYNQANDIYILR